MPVSKKRIKNSKPTQSKKNINSTWWKQRTLSEMVCFNNELFNDLGCSNDSFKLSNSSSWLGVKMVFVGWPRHDWCRFSNDYKL